MQHRSWTGIYARAVYGGLYDLVDAGRATGKAAALVALNDDTMDATVFASAPQERGWAFIAMTRNMAPFYDAGNPTFRQAGPSAWG